MSCFPLIFKGDYVIRHTSYVEQLIMHTLFFDSTKFDVMCYGLLHILALLAMTDI